MATQNATLIEAGNRTQRASWVMSAGDNGNGVALAGWPNKTIQVIGSGTVDMQGSNDGGTTWSVLNDALGNALTTKATGLYSVGNNPGLIRPNNVTTAAVTVILLAH